MALSPEQKVTQLLAAGQYGDIAPQLDDIELQVIARKYNKDLLSLIISKCWSACRLQNLIIGLTPYSC